MPITSHLINKAN